MSTRLSAATTSGRPELHADASGVLSRFWDEARHPVVEQEAAREVPARTDSRERDERRRVRFAYD